MIIDQTPLAGPDAYLTTPDGRINIVEGSEPIGGSSELADGLAHQVNAIELLIEGEDLLPLYSHQSRPLFAIELTKEMFPGLHSDPYASRIHQIGGVETFRRGEGEGMRPMEVNEVPTLVTIGSQTAWWRSPVYRLPRAVTIADIAWDLAPSRKTHPDAFRYQVDIEYWTEPDHLDSPGQQQLVVADWPPDQHRFRKQVNCEHVIAYRMTFKAAVRREAYMQELLAGIPDRDPFGIPLLQAFYLREPVPSRFAFASLLEVTAQATAYHAFEDGNGKARRLIASLPVAATLLKGESIRLAVHDERIKRLEARLNALVLVRSPKRPDEV
jgi:hypothetical protein